MQKEKQIFRDIYVTEVHQYTIKIPCSSFLTLLCKWIKYNILIYLNNQWFTKDSLTDVIWVGLIFLSCQIEGQSGCFPLLTCKPPKQILTRSKWWIKQGSIKIKLFRKQLFLKFSSQYNKWNFVDLWSNLFMMTSNMTAKRKKSYST